MNRPSNSVSVARNGFGETSAHAAVETDPSSVRFELGIQHGRASVGRRLRQTYIGRETTVVPSITR